MSRYAHSLSIAALLLVLPSVAFGFVWGVLGFLDVLISFVTTLVPILMGCAVVVFFWGVVKFVAHAGDEKAVEEGKQLIIWGLIGIFVIVALWGFVGYIQQSLGLDFGAISGTTAPSFPTVIPGT